MRGKLLERNRRSGIALVYLAVCMVAMMAFCSLAVDVGHYVVVQSELYEAAMMGARAGADVMVWGSTTTTNFARGAASYNTVDGFKLQTSNITVNFVNWNSTNSTYTTVSTANFSSANGVQVIVTYTLSLPFAQIIGKPTITCTKSSIAVLTKQSVSPYVYATANPWLAGEPTGTTGSEPDPGYEGPGVNPDHMYKYDLAGTPGGTAAGYWSSGKWVPGQPYSSPVQASITLIPGAIINITNTSGTDSYDKTTNYALDPTGNQTNNPWVLDDAASGGVSEHGIADVTMPIGALNAVFLGSSLPDNNTAPAPLNFSTQTERDYTTLDPLLQQPFFVGNGNTSGGTGQQIVVPQNATRLYLGVMDGWEWSNNTGGFNVTITQSYVTTVQ